MPKIDYSEWTELSAEITTQRLKIVSQFKSFNQAQQQFKGTKELTGTGWNSARDYFDGYTTVSDALFNALYEVDEATTEYVSAFTSEVGAAENQLDTEHLERLKSELRSLQAENDILMEAAAKAFENVPFINKFFMERSMLGKAKEIEILEKYQTFEAEHGGDFSEVQIVISSIEQGLAELGNAGNFLGGVEGYKKIVWKDQDWFQKIQDFNEKNKEDRYEIVVIHEDHDGKQFAIYKNGKLDEGRTLDYNKLLGKQDWELLKKLGPETIKMLLNLDDVEVLLDDESTTGQKVKASIMLILAVTPADKVKDVIKAAKLMKRGDHLLDGVKLTAKELDMLRDLEKSGERVKIVEKGNDAKKAQSIKRSQAELDELAKDPAHGGKIRDQGLIERDVGLGLEERGKVSGLKRDPSGSAEFIDATGQKWDVKGFNSSFPPKKGGYTLDKSMKSIQKSIGEGEYVMLDIRNLSAQHWNELKNEIIRLGLEGKVIWWP